MKIGLIADIHGNLPALEAVLDDMPPVDTIVCAGDIVGYNPWPRQCLERVREVCSTVVQGNHDRTVDSPHTYAHNEMAAAGLSHAKSDLSETQIEYLLDLPARTTIADGTYRLVHSHPDPDKLGTYVRPRDFPRMRPYLGAEDGLILGHTHIQHTATIDGKLIGNPGSVGQPRDGNADAAYAILDPEVQEIECRRVSYDINQVIARIESLDLPRKTGTRLLDGS